MTSEAMKVKVGAVEGLAQKLEALDLSADEAEVLDAILARAEAADGDVEGFEMEEEEMMPGIWSTPRLGRALGFRLPGNT